MTSERSHSATVVDLLFGSNARSVRLGRSCIDLGHVLEALVYYDRAYVLLDNPDALADLVRSFTEEGQTKALIRLVRDDVLVPYYYSSLVGAQSHGDIVLGIRQLRLRKQRPGGTASFGGTFLACPRVRAAVRQRRDYDRLTKALGDAVVIGDSIDPFPAFRNAERDIRDVERCPLYLQAAYEREYSLAGYSEVPRVHNVAIEEVLLSDGTLGHRFTWDLAHEPSPAGDPPDIGIASVYADAARMTRHVLTGSVLGVDLWASGGTDTLVGDKVYEAVLSSKTPDSIVGQLSEKVGFPSIGKLVNRGSIQVADVLELRPKASRFRHWLQSEAERDRDAIVAYHNEVGKQTGLIKFGRGALRLCGTVGGAVVGAAVDAPIRGALVGATVQELAGYVGGLGKTIDGGWRPVVFGNWYRERIDSLIRDRQHRGQ